MFIGASSLFLSRYSLAPADASLAASRTSGLKDMADWAELENLRSLTSIGGWGLGRTAGAFYYGVSKSLLSCFLLGEGDPPNGLKLFSYNPSKSGVWDSLSTISTFFSSSFSYDYCWLVLFPTSTIEQIVFCVVIFFLRAFSSSMGSSSFRDVDGGEWLLVVYLKITFGRISSVGSTGFFIVDELLSVWFELAVILLI